MRDHQRSKVYAFGRAIKNSYNTKISVAEINGLISQVLKDYEFYEPYFIGHGEDTITHPVPASFGGKCRQGAYVINIHPNMRNIVVVLHELAHVLAAWDTTYGHKHNAKFVAIFMDLMEYYLGLDKVWMEGLAARHDVEFKYKGYIPERQRNSRKYRYEAA